MQTAPQVALLRLRDEEVTGVSGSRRSCSESQPGGLQIPGLPTGGASVGLQNQRRQLTPVAPGELINLPSPAFEARHVLLAQRRPSRATPPRASLRNRQ